MNHRKQDRRTLIVFLVLFLCSLFGPACGETVIEITPDEWSWEAGSVSSFHGAVTPGADCEGAVLTMTVETRLEDSGEVFFTSFAGKNIKVKKRGPEWTADLTAGEETPFEGEWYLPEDTGGGLASATILLRVTDADGNEIARAELKEGSEEEETALVNSSPLGTVNRLMILLAAACVIVWGAAVGRHLYLNRKR